MSTNLQALTLHAHHTGPNPFKIAAALEVLAVPYTVKTWEFGDAPNGVKGAAFLKINPNGRVPALEDPNTGVVSWESGAIMNYIRRVYDNEDKLGPGKGATEQRIVDFEKWEYFLLTTLGPMTGQTNWFRHYNAEKNENALERYGEQTYRCYAVLEEQLGTHEGKYILPECESLLATDLHFYPWVKQYSFAGLSLERFPKVQRWLETMSDEVAVKAAYKRVEEAAKA